MKVAQADYTFGTPTNLGSTVNTASSEGGNGLSISADGLSIYFDSDRSSSYGGDDLWVATRATTNDDWTEPVNIGPPVNVSIISDVSPIVSYDGRTLYFVSYTRIGNYDAWDLWQAPIIPIVDLNSDGIVDSANMVIMVDHWGTDVTLCDIGPMPWGDGIVDVQDLIVLADHLFEEIP